MKKSAMRKALQKELPVGMASRCWKQELVHSCEVVNLERWNKNFPKWPVSRVAGNRAVAAGRAPNLTDK